MAKRTKGPPGNDLPNMKTMQVWNRMGYWVRKGSRAVAFTRNFNGLFTRDQVYRRVQQDTPSGAEQTSDMQARMDCSEPH